MKFFDKRLLKNIDWPLIIIMAALVGFGVVFHINSQAAAFTGEESGFAEIYAKLDLTYARLHLIWFATGLILMFLFCLIDYQTMGEIVKLVYIIICIVLFFLLFGQKKGGTAGWITFGSAGSPSERGFQPAEIAKLVLIVACAKIASSSMDHGRSRGGDIWKIIGVAAVPIALIMLQPDNGTAFVCIIIVSTILFMMGIEYKYIIGAILLLSIALTIWFYTGMPDFAKARIYNFLGLELKGALKAYDNTNVLTALDSIRAGGTSGLGLFSTTSFSKLGYLYADHTDFAYASGLEAVGFNGGATIIILYFAMMMRMLFLATKSKDRFGSFIIMGVIAMEFAHIFENIGMNIGILPVTGIPLPFISYGGSSMWANMLAVALVLNVSMRRPTKRYNMQI